MLILSEKDVAGLLPIGDVRDALAGAFRAQAEGAIAMPLRTVARTASGLLGSMPAAVGSDPAALGAKLVTFFPSNRDVPTHQALIALFDPGDGRPLALMDGRYITETRTAAASALATQALARTDARSLAVLGTGVQARAHILALAEVVPLQEVRIWGRIAQHAAAVADLARKRGLHARVATSAAEACREADVICTVTSAAQPILADADVCAGAHINAVGFSGPASRELPGALVARARIFIDSLDGARNESANIILAQREGLLPEQPALTLLCDVVAGKTAGRASRDDVTLFISLGIALEDVACARLAYERARARDVGTTVDFMGGLH